MKKVFLVLAVICVLCFFAVSASAAESGMIGDNISWTFSDDGVLTMTGSGEMKRLINSDEWFGRREMDIKKVVIGEGITTVSNAIFNGCQSLEEVVLPQSLESIGDVAFMGCENLKTAWIPDGVKYIGSGAFSFCKNLENSNLPASLEYLGERAFNMCLVLPYITIPANLKTIEAGAFEWCGITSIIIPENIEYIGVGAFQSCKYLKEIEILGNVKLIDEYAFAYCYRVEKVNFKGVVEEFGDYSFHNAGGGYDGFCLELPEGTLKVGNEAFSKGMVESVKIPASLSSIGESAFGSVIYGFDVHLDNMYFSSGAEGSRGEYNHMLFNKDRTVLYQVTTADKYGVHRSVVKIFVPDSVKVIKKGAIVCDFGNTVVLGSGLEVIEGGNFDESGPDVFVYNGDDFSKVYIAPGNTIMPHIRVEDADGNEIACDPYPQSRYTFVTNGGTPVADVIGTLEEAPVTTKRGYKLVGWCDACCENDGSMVEFPYTGDAQQLYAIWEKSDDVTIELQLNNTDARINTRPLELDAAPKAVNSVTMIPIRAVAEALGAEVDWHSEEQRAVIWGEDVTLVIYLGYSSVYVNNELVDIGVKSFAENGRTYLPLRFICESLGADVEWIQETQEIVITAPNPEA